MSSKMFYEQGYRLCLLLGGVIIAVEHKLERPLCPMVIVRRASPYLAVPVEAESYLIQLLTIACYILESGLFRMLSSLYGILLSRQSVGVISHRIEHVKALLTLIACIYVAGYISQRMTYMQSRSRRIRKHVKHIKLLSGGILFNVVGLTFHPALLPFLLNLSEIVIHFIKKLGIRN